MLPPGCILIIAVVVVVAWCGCVAATDSAQLVSQLPLVAAPTTRSLSQQGQDASKACRPLSKALLSQYAKHDIIMVAITDRITARLFGTSWVDNVETAGISYWMIAALDPETSLYFGADLGVQQCFNAPSEVLRGKGKSDETIKYQWGSSHWTSTTWLKVHVVRAIYALGYHILHCDMDSTWFADPMNFFMQHMDKPYQLMTSTDRTNTVNKADDHGMEVDTNPHTGINTGVYFFRQCPEGMPFIEKWLTWEDKRVGHDQDGLQVMMRGEFFGAYHIKDNKRPLIKPNVPRTYFGAYDNNIGVSFLPASMFANQYTYVNARFHQLLNHTLYEVHWVWGGNTLESKRQSMRDATKFVDPPAYYNDPNLVSIEMEYPKMPEGFNSIPWEAVESMIQFHIRAAEYQLQQLYYGFAMAIALNRTVVLPRILCFCSKNWYMTWACRLDPDHISEFPFTCSLSQVLRAKRLTRGLPIKDVAAGKDRVLEVREYSFLENRHTPDTIKKSRLAVQPTDESRGAATSLEELRKLVPPLGKQADGTPLLSLPWPLNDAELAALLAPHQGTRVLHFIKPARLFGPVLMGSLPASVSRESATKAAAIRGRNSFVDPELQFQFDKNMYGVTAYWCCRAPAEMIRLNETVRIEMDMVPRLQREALLKRPNGDVKRWHNRPMYGRRRRERRRREL